MNSEITIGALVKHADFKNPRQLYIVKELRLTDTVICMSWPLTDGYRFFFTRNKLKTVNAQLVELLYG